MKASGLDRVSGLIDWEMPIDTGVREALLQFLTALTDQYTLTGRRYNLRSLIRRHLDHPVEAFLSSAGFVGDHKRPLISKWGDAYDLRIDRILTRGVGLQMTALMAKNATVRATVYALIGAGYYLNGQRTAEALSIQNFEYCECCDRYTERYESTLERSTFLGRSVLIHPRITAKLSRRVGLDFARLHRFCEGCRTQENHEKKAYEKGAYGAKRGAIQFSRMVMEDHLLRRIDTKNFIDVPRFPAEYESNFHSNWQHTKRTIANFASMGPEDGTEKALERLKLLAKQAAQQNDFILELFQSILGDTKFQDGVQLPDWLLNLADDFTEIELFTLAGQSDSTLVGYRKNAIERTQISGCDWAVLKQRVNDLPGRLGIAPRKPIELELRDLSIHVRVELEDSASAGYVRLICRAERAFHYEWLLDYFDNESKRETKSSARKCV